MCCYFVVFVRRCTATDISTSVFVRPCTATDISTPVFVRPCTATDIFTPVFVRPCTTTDISTLVLVRIGTKADKLFEQTWSHVVKVLTPSRPGMTARDFVVLVLDLSTVEELKSLLAVVIGDI